jgi:transcriptional regulator
MSDDLDLVRGTLDLFILKTLTWGPRHGLAILRWIETVSTARLQIEEGALYPALHRLEQKELITGEWGVSENNRRARYYKLTPKGRKEFQAQAATWHNYVKVAAAVLAAANER